MRQLAIAGKADANFYRVVKERLQDKEIVVERFIEGKSYDAVLLMPDMGTQSFTISCNVLVVPDESSIKNVEAKSVVSYGMSQRNTVTLSSTQELCKVIALQRDVMSLDGKLILRQEFPLECDFTSYETLALASVLIITGALE